MDRQIFNPLLFVIMIIGLASCDCGYDYTYQVENQANGQIKVYFEGPMESDSIEIPVNETKVLFVTDHGTESCSDGPFYADVDNDIASMEIIKEDSLSSTKNYLFNGSWTYINGTYTARVTEDEF